MVKATRPRFCFILSFVLSGLGCKPASVQAGFACDDPVIDASEIASTPVARRLVKQGFSEEPSGSGLYRKKDASWKWLKETFGLPGGLPAPGPSVDSWIASTRIEGNHTVLEPEGEARGGITEDTPLTVTVNLGYARPRQVCVGMTAHRVAEALALVGAKERTGPDCPAATRAPRGRARRCYLLPDQTGLVVEEEKRRRVPGEKPVEALVTALIAGEKAGGFQYWKTQRIQRPDKYSVIEFRTLYRAAELPALCAGWKEHTKKTFRDFRVVSCGIEKHAQPVAMGKYRLSILEVLWTSGKVSFMDRWIVLHDGKGWKVVADLNGLFSGGWVGVQSKRLVERTGGGTPEMLVETIIRNHPRMDCLSATETIRSMVLCGEKGGEFCCLRFDTYRQLEIEMAGTVHPMASIYNHGEAERCRATLERHGLSAPDKDRKVLEQVETPVVFVGEDRVKWVSPAGRSAQRPLADVLAEGRCAEPAFGPVPPEATREPVEP